MGETEGPSDDELRAQIIQQLRESLAGSREMMNNMKLDPKTRERWTQLHTNTAQVLNAVLRDQQAKDWERSLKELEKAGYLTGRARLRRTIKGAKNEVKSSEAS